MRLINMIFIAIIAFVLCSVGYVYVQNQGIMATGVKLWSPVEVKVSTLLIGVFLLGFILNLLYTGIMELRRLIRGFSASAATRAGKRLSSVLQEARELLAHGLPEQARPLLENLEHAGKPLACPGRGRCWRTCSRSAAIMNRPACCWERP
jgi:uncharacterized membrane protein YciS (DUF1049 family)